MSERSTPRASEAGERRPGAVISAEATLRLVLGLLALWTLLSGLVLVFFQDASAATIGGGLKGDDGDAAQRLLGVHLLVLAPVYGLIAWQPQRYRLLLWIPYAAQIGVVIVMLYDMVTDVRDFGDGALPLIVAIVFLVLLLYVTFAGRRPEPQELVRPEPAPRPTGEPETEPDASAEAS